MPVYIKHLWQQLVFLLGCTHQLPPPHHGSTHLDLANQLLQLRHVHLSIRRRPAPVRRRRQRRLPALLHLIHELRAALAAPPPLTMPPRVAPAHLPVARLALPVRGRPVVTLAVVIVGGGGPLGGRAAVATPAATPAAEPRKQPRRRLRPRAGGGRRVVVVEDVVERLAVAALVGRAGAQRRRVRVRVVVRGCAAAMVGGGGRRCERDGGEGVRGVLGGEEVGFFVGGGRHGFGCGVPGDGSRWWV
jgi:hypothetical protein